MSHLWTLLLPFLFISSELYKSLSLLMDSFSSQNSILFCLKTQALFKPSSMSGIIFIPAIQRIWRRLMSKFKQLVLSQALTSKDLLKKAIMCLYWRWLLFFFCISWRITLFEIVCGIRDRILASPIDCLSVLLHLLSYHSRIWLNTIKLLYQRFYRAVNVKQFFCMSEEEIWIIGISFSFCKMHQLMIQRKCIVLRMQ